MTYYPSLHTCDHKYQNRQVLGLCLFATWPELEAEGTLSLVYLALPYLESNGDQAPLEYHPRWLAGLLNRWIGEIE